ncbi:type II CRISPR-associated endonuclease Cas1 [Saccharibacter sp. 17.LH.SD]|uniref:type II CRISPR-associated endonuclease Cas1 n=1 Tax=Saccharibacter sp. 17.LH.SD TaxID=2689393 RepID=UPI001F00EB54|nr:type II CRISPR-associated endonuclease Cas1 [Saccharibacter sp. 17.LH.SD]
MAWRSVHLSRPSKLRLKDHQLAIFQGSDTTPTIIPLEDLACLVFDTPQINLSGALLSACVTRGITLIIPDEKHHPAGLLLPFHQHHAQAEILSTQIDASQPLRKRLWQQLVMAKIKNQATVLAECNPPDAIILRQMTRRVMSGDPENIEAQAARFYWSRLFSKFTRADPDDKRNGLLNYGYAILRSAIARSCVASGLVPALGVHHSSRTNAFNLVDDLIEPFRPAVDRMIYRYDPEPNTAPITLEERRLMANILTEEVFNWHRMYDRPCG